jgi:hypothetical protein
VRRRLPNALKAALLLKGVFTAEVRRAGMCLVPLGRIFNALDSLA